MRWDFSNMQKTWIFNTLLNHVQPASLDSLREFLGQTQKKWPEIIEWHPVSVTTVSLCCFGGKRLPLTHLSSRFSVHAHRIICCNLFKFPLFHLLRIMHTAQVLKSRALLSFFSSSTSYRIHARNNLIWSLAPQVKRVNKTCRHGVPSPPRVAKRSLPGAPHIATNLLSWSLSLFSLSCLTRSF